MFFVMIAGLTLFAPFLAHHVREKSALRAFQNHWVTEDADSKGRSSPVAARSNPPPSRPCERGKQSVLLVERMQSPALGHRGIPV